MSENPIEKFKKIIARAKARGHLLPDAFALSTLDTKGRPTCRMMLLKEADDRGFVFYTNLRSRKAMGLKTRPRAALCFWWPEIEEQIRVEGFIKRVSDKEADEYFATRPRGSQIGAWASDQSEVLSSRFHLLKNFSKYALKFRGAPVPRPGHWSGYRLKPRRIEFWKNRFKRLHDRVLFVHSGSGWTKKLLYP